MREKKSKKNVKEVKDSQPSKVKKSEKSAPQPPLQARARTLLRRPLFWIILGIFVVSVVGRISSSNEGFTRIETSALLAAISKSEVESATIVDRDQLIRAILKPGEAINGATKVEASYVVGQEPLIVELLTSNPPPRPWDVEVPQQNLFLTFLFSLLPFLLIAFLLFFLLARSQGGSRVFSFGRSRARLQSPDAPKTTFADVAGADEAVAELREIKDFLADPKKYQEIGAKIPKGVLLYGPPGT
ncbi:MAG: ATP-dependent metallopeptidase FtsH/Yme1/Tma family protein, partial [Candidatus Nanopelagicaceae bacterium]